MLSLIVLAATAADRERALAALCAHEFRCFSNTALQSDET